jgi:acyl carrier protein
MHPTDNSQYFERSIMQEQIIQLIYTAIDDINRQNPTQKQVKKAPNTALFGSASELDSLGLINLVVAVEQKVEEQFNTTITLADDRALSQEISPFSTVQTLADYVAMLLNEKKHAA